MDLGASDFDPVADPIGWCEHLEPRHSFREETEARLLSGLSRVFRAYPVETSRSLRSAEWVVSEAAIGVIGGILSENVVTPKVPNQWHKPLFQPTKRPPVASERREMTAEEARVEQLLSSARGAVGGSGRAMAADLLGRQLAEISISANQEEALPERVGMEHPSSDNMLQARTHEFLLCDAGEEASLLRSMSASNRVVAFDIPEAPLTPPERVKLSRSPVMLSRMLFDHENISLLDHMERNS